ncbi:MAG: histidine kinase [Thermoleophilia bacterium]
MQSPLLLDSWVERLFDLQQVAWAVSIVFLLQFAVSMLVPRMPLTSRLKTAIPWFTVLWSCEVIIMGLVFLPHDLAQSWIRYMLGFPAAALTAISFLLERRTFAGYRESSRLNLTLIAATFGAYAILGGLIVPDNTLPGLHWLDYENVFAYTMMPIYFWRMLVGLCLTLLVVRTMHYFDLEFRTRLEANEKEQALAGDRLRIARDLHDGVVQSIYAVGLQLEVVAARMASDSGETAELIRRLTGQLNPASGYSC